MLSHWVDNMVIMFSDRKMSALYYTYYNRFGKPNGRTGFGHWATGGKMLLGCKGSNQMVSINENPLNFVQWT